MRPPHFFWCALVHAPPSRKLRSFFDEIDNFVRRFLAATHDVGPGESENRNTKPLKYPVAPPVIAGLIDRSFMECVTVSFHRDHRPMLVKTGNKYRQIDNADFIDLQLRDERVLATVSQGISGRWPCVSGGRGHTLVTTGVYSLAVEGA